MSFTAKKRIKRAVLGLIVAAPIILIAVALYDLFLMIIPFFLLNVHTLNLSLIFSETTSYEATFGVPISAMSFVLLYLNWPGLVGYLWLISLINFALTRKWYVLLALALAPLPIAYLNAGPYAEKMLAWVAPI
jgi:hypothetical protein